MLAKRTTTNDWGTLALLLFGTGLGLWTRSFLGHESLPEPAPVDLEPLPRVELSFEPAALAKAGSDPETVEIRSGEDRWMAEIALGDEGASGSLERPLFQVRLLEDTLQGLDAFRLRPPERDADLWTWFLLAAARREGILAPRAGYVELVWNGVSLGPYLLEEAVAPAFFEANARAIGPIVALGEDAVWNRLCLGGDPPSRSSGAAESPVGRVAGEVAFSSLGECSARLATYLDQLESLRAATLEAPSDGERLRSFQTIEYVRGEAYEALFDVEGLGRAHALLTLFQDERALTWAGQRYRLDPASDRLEPILSDPAPGLGSPRDPVPFRAPHRTASFAASRVYYETLFQELGRMLQPGWLDDLLGVVGPELRRFEAALARSDPSALGSTRAEMVQRLRAQVLYLRQTCLPSDAARFEAHYALDPGSGPISGSIQVRCWATTRSPVRVEGFLFSNGSFSPASTCLEPDALGATVGPEGVVLPPDGRPVEFRFPLDERLANLETVERLPQALREALSAPDTLDLDVRVVLRLLAAKESTVEVLDCRPLVSPGPQVGRPRAPDLEQALEHHPFLRVSEGGLRLEVVPGSWRVEGDLILPTDMPLTLPPGTRLAFEPGAVLLSTGALSFAGTPAEPVVLEARDTTRGWAGAVVLGAAATSHWEEVVVRDTRAVARGGWNLTGGVTFYRSPAALVRCRFEGTRAEDALNVVGAAIQLDRVTFQDCASDAFDGDFVTGEVRDCAFLDGEGDGIDISGSQLVVRNCHFERLLDKACSAGEVSRLRIEGGEISRVGIGVASKDASDVHVSGLTIREARHHGLVAFIKKPEYGPALLRADGVTITGSGRSDSLAQTGCRLEVDGVPIPTQAIDVEASYAQGVLGRAR